MIYDQIEAGLPTLVREDETREIGEADATRDSEPNLFWSLDKIFTQTAQAGIDVAQDVPGMLDEELTSRCDSYLAGRPFEEGYSDL
jgi:hypothetical protein